MNDNEIVTNLNYFKNLKQLNHMVLSGGGLGGSYYIYFLDRILSNKINVFDKTDTFTSNSVGSIITFLFILQYTINDIKDIIDELAKIFNVNKLLSPSLTLLKLTSFTGSYFSSDRLRSLLEKYIRESPLNKNIKNYNLGLDEITPENLTIDLVNKIYPNKIFNFITFNLNKAKIEIFSSTDIINKKANNMEDNKLNKLFDITYTDCIIKNEVGKLIDIVLGSSAVPYYFNSQKIDSKCLNNKETNYYADGFLTGGNIPVLLGQKINDIILEKSSNINNVIINNFVLTMQGIQNKKYIPKRGYKALFEFLDIIITYGSNFYTRVLSYDTASKKYINNNRYLNLNYKGSSLNYNIYLKNKKEYFCNPENYFDYILNYKFPDIYLEKSKFDYFRSNSNKEWIEKYFNKSFQK